MAAAAAGADENDMYLLIRRGAAGGGGGGPARTAMGAHAGRAAETPHNPQPTAQHRDTPTHTLPRSMLHVSLALPRPASGPLSRTPGASLSPSAPCTLSRCVLHWPFVLSLADALLLTFGLASAGKLGYCIPE